MADCGLTVECPNCGATSTVPREFCGRTVRCTRCQHRFAVYAPDDKPSPPPLRETGLSVLPRPPECDVELPAVVACRPVRPRRRKPRRRSTLILRIMLVCSVLWPVAMICVGFLFWATADRGRDISDTHYEYKDLRGIPDVGWKAERDVTIVNAAIMSGLCCPTVPYAIIMVILAVAHLATRDS